MPPIICDMRLPPPLFLFYPRPGFRKGGGVSIRRCPSCRPPTAAIVGEDGSRASRHPGMPHGGANLPYRRGGMFVRGPSRSSRQRHLGRLIAGNIRMV